MKHTTIHANALEKELMKSINEETNKDRIKLESELKKKIKEFEKINIGLNEMISLANKNKLLILSERLQEIQIKTRESKETVNRWWTEIRKGNQ